MLRMAMSQVIEIRNVIISSIFLICYEYDSARVHMCVRFFLLFLISCTETITCDTNS